MKNNKTAYIGVYVLQETKEDLQKIASENNRSLSSQIAEYIKDGINKQSEKSVYDMLP
jgi:hypothetical protein